MTLRVEKVEPCATGSSRIFHYSINLQGKTTKGGTKNWGNKSGREGTSLCNEVVFDEARLNYWPLRLGKPLIDLSTYEECKRCKQRKVKYLRREGEHALKARGLPHDMDGNLLPKYSLIGRGKCTCGDMSLPLRSHADRKRWHARHKGGIQAIRTRYDKEREVGGD